jgi:Asp-tRNA(Asn)/Glu-tRNA(Gln) amidotransferase A subunit family amidase
LRIALVTATPDGITLDPECKKAALDAAKLCEGLGHKVEEATLPVDRALLREAFVTVVQVSLARVLDDASAVLGREATEQDVEEATWAMVRAGRSVSGVSYSRAIAALHQIGLAMAKVATWGKAVAEFMPYTQLYNATGQPSMSVPLSWSTDGLPIGVMFSGRYGEDDVLLRLAAQLEMAQPWIVGSRFAAKTSVVCFTSRTG